MQLSYIVAAFVRCLHFLESLNVFRQLLLLIPSLRFRIKAFFKVFANRPYELFQGAFFSEEPLFMAITPRLSVSGDVMFMHCESFATAQIERFI